MKLEKQQHHQEAPEMIEVVQKLGKLSFEQLDNLQNSIRNMLLDYEVVAQEQKAWEAHINEK